MLFINGLNSCKYFEKTMNYLGENVHVFDLPDCRNSTPVVFHEESSKDLELFSGKHQWR